MKKVVIVIAFIFIIILYISAWIFFHFFVEIKNLGPYHHPAIVKRINDNDAFQLDNNDAFFLY